MSRREQVARIVDGAMLRAAALSPYDRVGRAYTASMTADAIEALYTPDQAPDQGSASVSMPAHGSGEPLCKLDGRPCFVGQQQSHQGNDTQEPHWRCPTNDCGKYGQDGQTSVEGEP